MLSDAICNFFPTIVRAMGFFLHIHTRRDVYVYAELESYFNANIKNQHDAYQKFEK